MVLIATIGRWIMRAIEFVIMLLIAGSITISWAAIAADFVSLPRF